MKEIISKDNQQIKIWAKLKQKKFIEQTNQVLLEGVKLINEAEERGVKFSAICTNFYTDEEFDCHVYKLSQQAFSVLSDTQNSQGIIAVANITKHQFTLPKGNFLVLDGINDPGNLGTIIRTAVACGFTEIYTINSVDYRNEKVLRATMGTVFDCKIMQIKSDELKQLSNFPLICADMSGQDVFKMEKPKKPFGIVMGNEAQGTSEETKSLCSLSVSLPMENKVESLNVAVACGILMYLLK